MVIQMTVEKYLEVIPISQRDPVRLFPLDWKEDYFRENSTLLTPSNIMVYKCPTCDGFFSGRTGFKKLQADHKIPHSHGGPTTKDNMILICKVCNLNKSNKL